MSATAALDRIGRVGAPVARAVDAHGAGGVLLCADRDGGALRALFHALAGRDTHVLDIGEELAATDGLRLRLSRARLGDLLHPGARPMLSLDRIGLPCPRVIGIALDARAVRERVWDGAGGLIARDRPLFIGQGAAPDFAGLAAMGYGLVADDGLVVADSTP